MRRTKNQRSCRGFSLMELLVSIGAFALIVGVFSSALIPMIAGQNTAAEIADLDRAKSDVYRLVLNPSALNSLLKVETTAGLEACLRGEGSDCERHSRDESAIDIFADARLPKFFGPQKICPSIQQGCMFERNVSYRWVCPSARHCAGAKVKVTIDRHSRLDGKSQETRVTRLFDQTTMVGATAFTQMAVDEIKACASGFPVGIDPKTNSLICEDRAGTVSCADFSVVGLESGDCGRAPAASYSNFCAMTLEVTPDRRLRLRYQVSSTDLLRLDISCSGAPAATFTESVDRTVLEEVTPLASRPTSTGPSASRLPASPVPRPGFGFGFRPSFGGPGGPAPVGTYSRSVWLGGLSATYCMGRVINPQSKTAATCQASYVPPRPTPTPDPLDPSAKAGEEMGTGPAGSVPLALIPGAGSGSSYSSTSASVGGGGDGFSTNVTKTGGSP